MKNYLNEIEGRIDFYNKLGYEGNHTDEKCNVDFSNNTDGVISGVLFEHKLIINNQSNPINKVLGQAIKYLSKKRINAIDVPDTIILVSLNDEIAYHFRSENYLNEIHKFYLTSSSVDNDFHIDVSGMETICFGENGYDRIKELIATSSYISVDVDINNIIQLARRYYKENKHAQKEDLLNEIRNPQYFKYINPYEKNIDDNSEFGYIMDKLNDEMLQQEIGAYYTPIEYSKKALDLIREAIANRPKGNDYVIIDRCAGTGNLEECMTDEELSHCVLNTYEYFEWLELRRQYAEKALYVIPKTEKTYIAGEGVIKEGDALTEEFFSDVFLRNLIADKKTTVIVFENPPYFSGSSNAAALVVNAASGELGKKRSTKTSQRSWVYARMKEAGYSASATANIVREFIWSAYTDYLRQDGDSLIVFAPNGYYKGYHIQDKMSHLAYDKGYGFNRKHFHASSALISCVKWDYKSEYDSVINEQKTFDLELFEINKYRQLEKQIDNEILTIKKSYSNPNYYFSNKDETNAFACLSNNGSAPKTGLGCLYSIAKKTGRKDEIYLNAKNFYKLLPVYIAQLTFDRAKWYNNDNTLRTADRKNDYLQCEELLKRSLIFTCLYQNNHTETTIKADGLLSKNELCFDNNTLASNKLKEIETFLDEADKKLLKRWEKVLQLAKQTNEYKANYKYGFRQIILELDTFTEVQKGLKIEKKYNNTDLHNNIGELKKEVKKYYETLIEPLLFEYELIK